MLYKTIVLELIEQNPQLHEQLRTKKLLLPTLERYSTELKTSHEQWKTQLALKKPGSDPSQIASEALELALKDLTSRLAYEANQDSTQPLSLDAAMAFLRRPTPPA
jgi:hypothetical protein